MVSKCCAIFVAVLAVVIGLGIYNGSSPPSPLLIASYRGDVDTVRRMLPLSQGDTSATTAGKSQTTDTSYKQHIAAQANVRDEWNNTALHWAAKGGNRNAVEVVEHLLAAGVDVAAKNNGGSTALHWACSVEDATVSTRLIELLHKRGVALNVANKFGETPLHWAVDWLRPHAVDMLLKLGADPNLLDEDGNTPLHKIKKDCDEKVDCTNIVSRLIGGGVNISLKNKYQRVALQYFNQDKEQQSQSHKQSVEQRVKKEKDAHADGTTSDPTAASSSKKNARLNEEDVVKIQKQFEEFKKNLTEGRLEEERHRLSEQREQEKAKAEEQQEDDDDEL